MSSWLELHKAPFLFTGYMPKWELLGNITWLVPLTMFLAIIISRMC